MLIWDGSLQDRERLVIVAQAPWDYSHGNGGLSSAAFRATRPIFTMSGRLPDNPPLAAVRWRRVTDEAAAGIRSPVDLDQIGMENDRTADLNHVLPRDSTRTRLQYDFRGWLESLNLFPFRSVKHTVYADLSLIP